MEKSQLLQLSGLKLAQYCSCEHHAKSGLFVCEFSKIAQNVFFFFFKSVVYTQGRECRQETSCTNNLSTSEERSYLNDRLDQSIRCIASACRWCGECCHGKTITFISSDIHPQRKRIPSQTESYLHCRPAEKQVNPYSTPHSDCHEAHVGLKLDSHVPSGVVGGWTAVTVLATCTA